MGWWSVEICGGDEPLDELAELERCSNAGEGLLYPLDQVPVVVLERVATWLAGAAAVDAFFAGAAPTPIRAQVWAAVGLAVGVLPTWLATAGVWGCTNDAWAAQDPDRAAAVARLQAAIHAHRPGVGHVIADISLFDTLRRYTELGEPER
jgi:hypothetical protein